MEVNQEKYPQMWLYQRKHISDPVLKDYIIKHAYVEFISPTGESQIGVNPRFNEQDEDEFRLRDKCIYSRGQPSQSKVSRKILQYSFYFLAILNLLVLAGLVIQTIMYSLMSQYRCMTAFIIASVSTILTIYGGIAMRIQSLTHLTIYTILNMGCSVILFPLSPTSLYFSHFLLELLLIYIASQLKYRLDDLWFVPPYNTLPNQYAL